MKKRIFSLALAVCLGLCAAAPASAAGGQSEEMARVTLAVKKQLGLGDGYENFSGDCTDLGVARYWRLEWSGEDGESLSVTADDAGKILSYNRFGSGAEQPIPYWDGGGFNPSFPAIGTKQVEQAANAFLARVLSAPESARLEPVRMEVSERQGSVFVYGSVLLNDVDTPMGFYMDLSLPDLTVTSYSRRDSWRAVVTGEVPSAKPAVSKETAQKSLESVLELELRYVDAGDETIALRYVPTTEGDWFVDARTGQLTDLSKLVEDDWKLETGGSADNSVAETASAPAAEPSLSPAEQATVDQMAGVLDAQALDQLLKKIAPLGLGKMTQAGASYSMDRETKELTCRLTYTRPLTKSEADPSLSQEEFASKKPTLRKYITVDAMTGALKWVSTSSGWGRELFKGDAAAVVKEFLSAQFPEKFAACASKDEDGLLWVRQINGIPYYSNYLRAEVCQVDGTIGSFSTEWDEEAKFPAPEKIVDEEAAMAAYAGCYTTELFYTRYPEKVDTADPKWFTYSQQMGNVAYRWVLSYVLDGDDLQGIDAFTGEAVPWPAGSGEPLRYTDCETCYGKAQIEALAEYGIGFGRGGQFKPTAQVKQRDMLVLLLSAVGRSFDADAMTEEEENELYDAAYRQGLLTRGERDPGRAVTRLEFLKVMLSASAYGKAAQVQGIYQVTFQDAKEIPAGDLGYAALAQGLGMVGGGKLRPNAALTRQDAAIMLCRFMAG